MTRAAASERWFWRYVAPGVLGFAALVVMVLALQAANEAPRLPVTASAAAQGPCLLPVLEMRRVHMDLLYDERRAAVGQGLRNPEARIERCVACHAVRDAAGAPISVADSRHFCRSCHDQVAVRIDCFSCHRSTPAIALASGVEK